MSFRSFKVGQTQFQEAEASPTSRELDAELLGTAVLPWLLGRLIAQRSELGLTIIAVDLADEAARHRAAKAQGKIEMISGLLAELADLPQTNTEGED